MAQLVWDGVGEKLFETGVDHGVLYLSQPNGGFGKGVVWNGLTAVTESPSGAEANPQYADNIKYLNLLSAEEFGATIEAFTYPDEFAECDGTASPVPGLSIGQQPRKTFGFSYRTLVGNDTQGQDFGYKLHLVYGALAAPSEKAYATVNDSPEAITFSWEVTTTPVPAGEGLRPTASITVDSTKVDAAKMQALEAILYGSAEGEARLPSPAEVVALLSDGASTTEVIPVAPTFDDDDLEISIPTVTGVRYQISGSPVTGTVTIEEETTVTAVPEAGYRFPTSATTSWTFGE